MRVNTTTLRHALLAVGYIAQHKGEGLILSQSIAKEYNINLEYLAKIMLQLVRANVLRSKRGPHGGYSLAKPPNKITMLQVIEAVDGPMHGQLGLSEHTKGKFSVKAEQAHAKAINQTKAVFQKTKMSDLL